MGRPYYIVENLLSYIKSYQIIMNRKELINYYIIFQLRFSYFFHIEKHNYDDVSTLVF